MQNILKTSICYQEFTIRCTCERVELKSNLGNSALKISGGQLQRINLARALYRKPKF